MTTLVFKDKKWTVVTSAWTAGAKGESKVRLNYLWGAQGFSDLNTGVYEIELPMTINEFLLRIADKTFVDLTHL